MPQSHPAAAAGPRLPAAPAFRAPVRRLPRAARAEPQGPRTTRAGRSAAPRGPRVRDPRDAGPPRAPKRGDKPGEGRREGKEDL